jgi:hypothetical protein
MSNEPICIREPDTDKLVIEALLRMGEAAAPRKMIERGMMMILNQPE